MLLVSNLSWSESPSKLPDRIFELPPLERMESSRSIEEILRKANQLNSIIGRYPPSYKTEEEREKTYNLWVDLLLDVSALGENSEELLFLHSQLYRQGHNMDVRSAAHKSEKYIKACIAKYKKSEKCHLEATFLYLQVGPPNLKLAKKSLKTLSKMYKPNLNEEVEAGYVFLYLYSRDEKRALKQIEKYLSKFSSSSRAAMFQKIQVAIQDSGIGVK